ncbi:MAG TPA: hypothetical protein VFT57_13985 [Gemmatimonadaceae bacterium]|jgi:hypothetical protein|nr:hypothetical protein [Gemmatimonadaceae bacterium]
MRLIAILLASMIGACGHGERPAADSAAQRSETRTAPVFEIGLWPGEGIPVIAAVRDELPLLRSPSPESGSAGSLSAAAGARITYDSTRLQTISPATVKVTDSAVVRGRFLGAVHVLSRDRYYSDAFHDTTIALTRSERFEYLQPRAEGSCFVSIDGSVVEANPCPTHDSASFALSGEPELRWWIFAASDSASGWLLVSDSTAKVVRREF